MTRGGVTRAVVTRALRCFLTFGGGFALAALPTDAEAAEDRANINSSCNPARSEVEAVADPDGSLRMAMDRLCGVLVRGEEQRRNLDPTRVIEMLHLINLELDLREDDGEQAASEWLSKRLPELYHRLGERQAEMADKAAKVEVERHMAAVDACSDTPGCKTNTLQDLHTVQRSWEEKALLSWSRVTTEYPAYAARADVEYAASRMLIGMGRETDAQPHLKRLITESPYSPPAPYAYAILAETQYNDGLIHEALLNYLKAMSYADLEGLEEKAPAIDAAICYQRLGQAPKAVVLLERTLDRAMARPAVAGQPFPLPEVFDVLAMLYAETSTSKEGLAYIEKFNHEPLARVMIERLGDAVATRGNYGRAIEIYEHVLERFPTIATRPSVHESLIDAWDKLDKKPEAFKEIVRFRDESGPKSAWAAAMTDPTVVAGAQERIRARLATTAIKYHREGVAFLKSGYHDRRAFVPLQLAETGYKLYVEAYPEHPDAQQIYFNLGELSYDHLADGKPPGERMRQARDAYSRAALLDPELKNPRMSNAKADAKAPHDGLTYNAARSAVYAGEKLLPATKKGPGPSQMAKATPLNADEEAFVAAVDTFVLSFPADAPEVAKALFASAKLLLNHGYYARAGFQYLVVIGFAPDTDTAVDAAEAIIESLEARQDWAASSQLAQAFYGHPAFPTKERKAKMYTAWQLAEFNLRELAPACVRATKEAPPADPRACALSFLDYYAKFSGSDKRDRALNMAATDLTHAGEIGMAAAAREELIKTFPTSEWREASFVLVGEHYEGMARFDQAAAAYERALDAYPANAKARTNIAYAGHLRQALGDPDRAVKNLRRYLATAAPSPDRVAAASRLADVLSAANRHAEAADVLRSVFEKPRGASVDDTFLARLRYGRELEALGHSPTRHWRDSLAAWQVAAAADPTLNPDAAAEMLYALTEPSITTFEAIRLNIPSSDKDLKKALVAKSRALADIEAEAGAIVDTRSGRWGIHALVRFGQAQEGMADALEQSYVPPSLTPDQREIYRMALEDRAFPLREKAREAYTAALAKASELVSFDGATVLADARRSALFPDEFPPRAEILPPSNFLASGIENRPGE